MCCFRTAVWAVVTSWAPITAFEQIMLKLQVQTLGSEAGIQHADS
jgi:hypothetical protein